MGIWQDKGGLTTQQIYIKVRERVWEIAQSMSIINIQGTGPDHVNLLLDCCVTRISDLESKWLHWKGYIADHTNLDGQKLKAPRDESAEVCLRQRKNVVNKTPTKKRKLMHIGMYFVAPMLLLLFLIMCRSRRR